MLQPKNVHQLLRNQNSGVSCGSCSSPAQWLQESLANGSLKRGSVLVKVGYRDSIGRTPEHIMLRHNGHLGFTNSTGRVLTNKQFTATWCLKGSGFFCTEPHHPWEPRAPSLAFQWPEESLHSHAHFCNLRQSWATSLSFLISFHCWEIVPVPCSTAQRAGKCSPWLDNHVLLTTVYQGYGKQLLGTKAISAKVSKDIHEY